MKFKELGQRTKDKIDPGWTIVAVLGVSLLIMFFLLANTDEKNIKLREELVETTERLDRMRAEQARAREECLRAGGSMNANICVLVIPQQVPVPGWCTPEELEENWNRELKRNDLLRRASHVRLNR